MKIAYRKSTGEVINDFQDFATEEGLLKNAEAMGIPKEDVEVREVTNEEFDIENQKIIEAGKAKELEDKNKRDDLIASIKTKMKNVLKLTDEELNFLFNR